MDITHIKSKTIKTGGWGFGVDGKEKIVEGKMKRKYDDKGNITKEKFRATSKEDRKMFRKIARNKRKGERGPIPDSFKLPKLFFTPL